MSTPPICSLSSAVWDRVSLEPPDAIFGVTDAWTRDTRTQKINLGVGAYRDDNGKPFILPSILKAEQKVVGDPAENKEYLPIDGLPAFRKAAALLAFGKNCKALAEERIAIAQTISGTGALFIGATFIARHMNDVENSHRQVVLLPDPTWGNHLTIFRHAGLDFKRYRYVKFSDSSHAPSLDIEGMLADLESAPNGVVVLLHACAHNPTGIDPTPEQWTKISHALNRKGHIAFFDMAYQGFASGSLDADAAALRAVVARDDIPVILAQSFAKNMGLYNERVGTISFVCKSCNERDRVQSHLRTLARPVYSNPPAHGSKIANVVLNDTELHKQWVADLELMSSRLSNMRRALREALQKAGSKKNWSHITDQIGMFCYTGLTKDQVARLGKDFGIYMTSDGRISIAGINNRNVDYLAQAVHIVTDCNGLK